jgi:integrase
MGGAIISESGGGIIPLRGAASSRNWGAASSGISKLSPAVRAAWRDEIALKSRRQADYAWTVLARVLSWSKHRGLISDNPCERGGRLYRGSRNDHVWTTEDEAAFYGSAPAHLHLPVLMALWTGQRQGDLLRLP